MNWFNRCKSPEDDPSSIGNVLLCMGILKPHELQQVVNKFKASKEELLGQFIIRETHVTEHQLEIALLKQKVMRGESDRKVLNRLLEISQESGDRVRDRLSELTTVVKAAKGKVA